MTMATQTSLSKATQRRRYSPIDPSLPKPWRAIIDGITGYLYFWNPVTNITQYQRPCVEHDDRERNNVVVDCDNHTSNYVNYREQGGSSMIVKAVEENNYAEVDDVVKDDDDVGNYAKDREDERGRSSMLVTLDEENSDAEMDSLCKYSGTSNDAENGCAKVENLGKECDPDDDAKDPNGEQGRKLLLVKVGEEDSHAEGDDVNKDSDINSGTKDRAGEQGLTSLVKVIDEKVDSNNASNVVALVSTSKDDVIDRPSGGRLCREDGDSVNLGACNMEEEEDAWKSNKEEGIGELDRLIEVKGNDQEEGNRFCTDYGTHVLADNGNSWDKSMQCSIYNAAQMVVENRHNQVKYKNSDKDVTQVVADDGNGHDQDESIQSSGDNAARVVEDHENSQNKSRKPGSNASQVVDTGDDWNKLMQSSNDHASQVAISNRKELNKSPDLENNDDGHAISTQSSSDAPQVVANSNNFHGSCIKSKHCNKRQTNNELKFDPSKRPRYAPADTSLPKPWRALVDGNTGYLYFWNPITKVTQYERPVPLIVQPSSIEAMSSHLEDGSSPLQFSNECTTKVNSNDPDKSMQCSNDGFKVSAINDSSTSGLIEQPCHNINVDACKRPQYAPLDSSLPKPWRALVDGNSGNVYFWNPVTKVTQYERPDLTHAQPTSLNATKSFEGPEPSNTNLLGDDNDQLHDYTKNGQLPSISERNVSNQNLLAKVASSTESDHVQHEILVTGSSPLDNVDEWKWKLSALLLDETKQEIVTRERKDRRDYEQLAVLADSMCLYSRQYETVVVFSKVPLPNYRFDLDDKRPQREVSVPTSVQREVEAYLEAYLARKQPNQQSFPSISSPSSSRIDSFGTGKSLLENPDPQTSTRAVSEKVLRLRSMQLCNQQQAWQESPEGQRMLEFRKSLPAYKEKEHLLNALSQNKVIVISGETGCGKTTQIPQCILESEIDATRGAACNIICTQPRRISAMSVSERVAAERGEKLGESVGYKVRLEGEKGRDTRLLFCTTGVLLRRLLVDRNLKGVTHVVADEIHERGMNEDFLLIVLKDLLSHRPDLRLILMSATLNAELFSSYFGGAPMIHIPGFTYPVRAHFLENVLEVIGHVLTPDNQIDDYGLDKSWKMQKQALRKRKSKISSIVEDALEAADFWQCSPMTRDSLSCWNPDSIGFYLIESLLCHICQRERPGAVLVFMIGWEDINCLKEQLQANPLLGNPNKVLLLPCHGSMESSEQRLIFDKPKNGARKIVLATNMAETSITIDDVVFVVDLGKAKETSYDALNNTPCLLPAWISKASVRQRRGRAGRVQPGECYHLYPRCVYDVFAEFQLPELIRTPLQSLCLQIKSLKLGSISEFLSRALQPPEQLSVQNAIDYLQMIGALDESEDLTILGHYLSMLPVEPKLGKMLIYGAIFSCLDPILTVVAGLSARDPFLSPFDKKELAEAAKSQFSCQDYSDHLALVRAHDGWNAAEKDHSGYEYCSKNFLSMQTMKAIDSLRKQFLDLLINTGLVAESFSTCNKGSRDEKLVRAVICAGLYPSVCSVINKDKSISLKTMEDGHVMLYSNSVNGREAKIPYPWLVFNEKVKVNSVFLRDSTGVSDSVLLLFGGDVSRTHDGHLEMLGGYLKFFMKPELQSMYLILKRELNELIQKKLANPKMDLKSSEDILSAVRLLINEDPFSGRFMFGDQEPKPKRPKSSPSTNSGGGGDNAKNRLQTMVTRAGHPNPVYCTKKTNNLFISTVEFSGMQSVGQPCATKKLAEMDAAAGALNQLLGGSATS